jgi:hydrogenase maturation protein HypF
LRIKHLLENSELDLQSLHRFRYIVNGIVQGVGFRPFIYRLAESNNLNGFAFNSTEGVVIEVEGKQEEIDKFESLLYKDAPPLARILNLIKTEIPTCGESEFRILPSKSAAVSGTVIIPPDISTCEKCFSELNDKTDRRFGYPFINCTDCGPRYTIIRDLPYDRQSTTMNVFELCPFCQNEYENPNNRRFHAEPNACPVCGPSLSLYRSTDSVELNLDEINSDAISKVIAFLEIGKVIAIKSLGGFHIACDADNKDAIVRLRSGKNRPSRPLAVMAADLDTVSKFANFNRAEAELLAGRLRPIVLLEKRTDAQLADNIAPGNGFYGVMLPYTPLHNLLMKGAYRALVMTSANNSGEPIIIDNARAVDALKHSVDFIMSHNRDILVRCDDSIARWDGEQITYLRISRGVAPLSIELRSPEPDRLAVGAELKNTFCLVKNNFAYVSGHIGDLEQKEILDCYRENIEHLIRVIDIKPKIIIHDLHPDYLSTRFALDYPDCDKAAVQHHHAHVLSAMAEHKIDGEVIGIALDGTGFGDDGTIWGGEILVADRTYFERIMNFKPVPLPGGDAAAREPWKMAFSYIRSSFPDSFDSIIKAFIKKSPISLMNSDEKRSMIDSMIRQKINSPLSSSAGRLFAAISALLGLKETVSYEGEAESILEWSSAFSNTKDSYPSDDFSNIIPTVKLFSEIVNDYLNGSPVDYIGMKFHNTLIILLATAAQKAFEQTKIRKIVLTGGVFQNMLLLKGLRDELRRFGFEPITHSSIPTNDAGISIGQAYYIRKR